MRLKQLVVPLTLISFIGLQVLLFGKFLGTGTSSSQLKREEQEALLDDQLESLQTSTSRLKDLHLRLESKLQELGIQSEPLQQQQPHTQSDGHGTQQADVLQVGRANAADTNADAIDAMESKIINMANLVDKLGNVGGVGAVEKQSTATVQSMTTQEEKYIFPSGNEDGECVAGQQPGARQAVAAVVTVTFDRADYLKRHLDSLMAVHGRDPSNMQKFPLHISQDGKVPKDTVANLAKSYSAQGVRYLHHEEDEPPKRMLNKSESLAYYRIANHYKFIMRTFFDCFGYSKLVILEDDMELAPDFFSYFELTSRLLTSDPSLYCISSWNDHGQKQFVRDEARLYRSDFFPGLGWMLTLNLWREIRDDWPQAYWDDWMRLNKTRKGRQCIRPEVCRTYNFGEKGSSKGFYYKRFLAPIRLSAAEIDWSKVDLSYLQQSRYEAELNATLAAAKPMATVDEAKDVIGDVLLMYDSQDHYESLTGRLGMLREWKDGVPRGSYRGVVIVHWSRARILLAASPKFTPLVDTGAVRVDSTGAVLRRKVPKRQRYPADKYR